MAYRVLPPALRAALIEGIEDELTPAVQQQQETIQRTPCGRCGSAMEPSIYGPHAFSPDRPLPRTVARCVECGYTLDPHSNLVLDTGDPRRIEEALPLVRPDDD